MPRIFKKKGGGDDDLMTISGFSMGTSSVSDRIMGRMRMSLSGISGRNLTSAKEDESLDSGSHSGGKSSRRSTLSRPSFSRRKRSSSVGKMSMPMPGLDPSATSNTRSGSSSSNVVDGMMAEMDSTETMALRGTSMGRRAPSAPPMRSSLARAPSAPALRNSSLVDDRFGKARKATLNRNKISSQSSRRSQSVGRLDAPPMECSLQQLRQMSELELEKTLDKAGVSPEEVDKALDEVAAVDTSIATIAEDQRKNALVMLLINSGKVKLVRADKAHQDSTRTLQTANSVGEGVNKGSLHKDSMYDGTDASISSIPYNDEMGGSVRSGLSVASSTRQERRKSKLDKIFELQTENSNIKRENKSLKKTVKKLLDQLTNVTQKEKETAALAEKYKQQVESAVVKMKSETEGPKDDDDADKTTEINDSSKELGRRDSDQSVDKVKQKLKDERSAHQSTEFRLKVRCFEQNVYPYFSVNFTNKCINNIGRNRSID